MGNPEGAGREGAPADAGGASALQGGGGWDVVKFRINPPLK